MLISVRAPVGALNIADQEIGIGRGVSAIRAGLAVDERFLFYAVQSSITLLRSWATGTTYEAVTAEDLGAIPVPVRASLDEERRIADFLDDQVTRIDNIIAARRAQADRLAEASRAAVSGAVRGEGMGEMRPSMIPWAPCIPIGWRDPRIAQVAMTGTGHTPSRSVNKYWQNCDIPWLTTADVHKFRKDQIDVLPDTVFKISALGLAHSSAVLHEAQTVALSRTASAGFSIILDRPAATSQDYITWTCGPLLRPVYLLWCLRTMRADIMGRLAIGSTHKTIYFPDALSIRIPLPTVPEQIEIEAKLVAALDAERVVGQRLGEIVTKLEEMKRSLITSAVTGNFDVSTADGSRVPV